MITRGYILQGFETRASNKEVAGKSWIMLEAARKQDLRDQKVRKFLVTLRSLLGSLPPLKKVRLPFYSIRRLTSLSVS